MTIEEQRILFEYYLDNLKRDRSYPMFSIGQRVVTKSDVQSSYITLVIGRGTKGTIIGFDDIPLVDFGVKGTFYVRQDKLKKA